MSNKNLQKLDIKCEASFDTDSQTIALRLHLPTAVRLLNKRLLRDDDGRIPTADDIEPEISQAEAIKILDKVASLLPDDVELNLDGGKFNLVPIVDGHTTGNASETDDVASAIIEAGDIRNHHMWKQWVMAQMLRIIVQYNLSHTRILKNADGSMVVDSSQFSRHLRRISIERSHQIVVSKLVEQKMMLRHNDHRCYDEDSIDYNKRLVLAMIDEYIATLRKYISKLQVRRCKGRAYVKIKCAWFAEQGAGTLSPNYKGTFLDDLHKIYDKYISFRDDIANTDAFEEWLSIYEEFTKYIIPIHDWSSRGGYTYPCTESFRNAYMSYGCYHTLMNMIRFHKCCFDGLDREQSIARVQALHTANNYEAYKLMAVLKLLISDSHFDIESDLRKWEETHRDRIYR